MNKRISTTLLFLTRYVTLKFHVNLTSRGKDGVTDIPNAFHTVYENSNGKYITYDVNSYITLDIKDKSGYWDKSKSVLITPRNIFQLLTHLSKMIANIYREDCFYIENNDTKVNKETLEEYTVRAYNLGNNQRIVMQPSVVYETVEDTYYEGATFYLNNSENVFSIPIDLIETLYYTLNKVDFMVYTGTLLNYYLQRVLDDEEDVEIDNRHQRKPHVFTNVTIEDIDEKKVEESQTKSNIIKEETAEKFFDME